MKTPIAAALAAAAWLAVPTVFAQGPLAPSGAPQATMKSLDQIEPRTPVDATHTPGSSSSQFIISQPGSYYLTGDLGGEASKNCITITASDVSLDLGGHSMTGLSSALQALYVSADIKNLSVHDGSIKGWTNAGIWADRATQSRIERMHISGCHNSAITLGASSVVADCTATGNIADTCIQVGDGCMVQRCIVSNNYARGILAGNQTAVIGCASSGNTTGIETGDNCLVVGCTTSNNTGSGIILHDSCRADACTASHNLGTSTTDGGISANIRSVVENCTVEYNTGDGIRVGGDCILTHNLANLNTGTGSHAGILTNGAGNRIEGNHVDSNTAYGIRSSWGTNSDNTFGNKAAGNSTSNYSPSSGATFAPVQAPATATSPFANY